MTGRLTTALLDAMERFKRDTGQAPELIRMDRETYDQLYVESGWAGTFFSGVPVSIDSNPTANPPDVSLVVRDYVLDPPVVGRPC